MKPAIFFSFLPPRLLLSLHPPPPPHHAWRKPSKPLASPTGTAGASGSSAFRVPHPAATDAPSLLARRRMLHAAVGRYHPRRPRHPHRVPRRQAQGPPTRDLQRQPQRRHPRRRRPPQRRPLRPRQLLQPQPEGGLEIRPGAAGPVLPQRPDRDAGPGAVPRAEEGGGAALRAHGVEQCGAAGRRGGGLACGGDREQACNEGGGLVPDAVRYWRLVALHVPDAAPLQHRRGCAARRGAVGQQLHLQA
ncbi:unnamed protein product, partial [Musa hybrid cultivar]